MRISSFILKWNKFQLTIGWLKSGKKEKSLISDQEKYCADNIAKLEESLKKKKQVNNNEH